MCVRDRSPPRGDRGGDFGFTREYGEFWERMFDPLREFLIGTGVKVESTTRLLGVGVSTRRASGNRLRDSDTRCAESGGGATGAGGGR